eukprot:3819519-Amphidinium_carterae.1
MFTCGNHNQLPIFWHSFCPGVSCSHVSASKNCELGSSFLLAGPVPGAVVPTFSTTAFAVVGTSHCGAIGDNAMGPRMATEIVNPTRGLHISLGGRLTDRWDS